LDERRTGVGMAVFLYVRHFEGDKQMTIDRWLMIAVDVLLPLWIVMRIIMLPVMLNSPENSRSLTTYMQYWAEQRGKPRRNK
jgi:hypothetical protein